MAPGMRIERRSATDRRVRTSLRSILRRNVLCSIATVGPAKRAHVNTAYFAADRNGRVYFCSYPESDHSANIRRSSTAALCIFDSHQTWGGADCGLQLFGAAVELPPGSDGVARRVYGNRFRGFSTWYRSLTAGGLPFPLRFYRFSPRRAKIFDETTFGSATWIDVRLGPVRRPRSNRSTGSRR